MAGRSRCTPGPPIRESSDQFLTIDAASLASLEIERTMRAGQYEGSLLSVLQRCVTPMGKRLLRHWLCFPLRDLAGIEARQDQVAVLQEDLELAQRLGGQIAQIQDVARIAGRVSMGKPDVQERLLPRLVRRLIARRSLDYVRESRRCLFQGFGWVFRSWHFLRTSLHLRVVCARLALKLLTDLSGSFTKVPQSMQHLISTR